MGVTVGELEVRIAGEIAELKASLKDANADIAKFKDRTDKELSDVEDKTGRVSSAFKLLGVTIGAVTFAAIIKGALGAAQGLKEIGESAKALGLTTTDLQELRGAAADAGIAFESFDNAFVKFSRLQADAARGGEAGRKAFGDLKISVANADGTLRGAGDVLADVADRLNATTDPAERLRLAFQLFGPQAQEFIKLLGEGAAGLEAARAKFAETGGVVEKEFIGQMAEAVKQVEALQRGISADLTRALASLAPSIGVGARRLADFAEETRGLVDLFQQVDDRATRTLQAQSVELTAKLAQAESGGGSLIERIVGKLRPGFTEDFIAGLRTELAAVEAELAARTQQRKGAIAGAGDKPLAPPVTPPPTADDKAAIDAAKALAAEQERNLQALVNLEDRLRIARAAAIEPLDGAIEKIDAELRAIGELKLNEEGRAQAIETVNGLVADRIALQKRITDGQAEGGALEIELARGLEELRKLDRLRADEIERAVRLRLAEKLGVEETNKLLAGALGATKTATDKKNEELKRVPIKQGEELGKSVETNVASGLVAGLTGDGLDAFGSSLEAISKNALGNSVKEMIAGIADDLGPVLKEAFKGIGGEGGILGGLNLGAAAGALVGVGGSLLGAALKKGGSSQSFTPVQSAVTSTQEVRGIVAGPTAIPIAQIGNSIRDAGLDQLLELRSQTGLLRSILGALARGASPAAAFAGVSSELNSSTALA